MANKIFLIELVVHSGAYRIYGTAGKKLYYGYTLKEATRKYKKEKGR